MSPMRPRGKVFVVSIDEPLQALRVGPGYFKVVLIVRSGRTVVGQVVLPAMDVVPVDVQRAAIAEHLGATLWRREARSLLERACGVDDRPRSPDPSVSVVVCTRDRPDDLERCLEALGALSSTPLEIVVVDNASGDDRTRRVCEQFPVRYVEEPVAGQSRARNRGILETSGELVAFTDDDCVVDPGWLDDLHVELEDPLVQALTGYVGPLELETPAQFLFESHGGFARGLERRVFHGVWANPALTSGQVGSGANSIFRRTVFERLGMFAEDLGPGTPARAADDNDMFCRILDAGYRIAFDPARVVWHRHRRDDGALRAILSDYGVSSSAFAARRVGRHRDLSALRIFSWWWLEHFPRDVRAILSGRPAAVPVASLVGEMVGTFRGPWRLMRSRRSRSRIPEISVPAAKSPVAQPTLAVDREWPSVTVVIPTRNRHDRLQGVLQGLSAQTFPSEKFEAVVVLDGCTDDSAELVRSLDLPYGLSVVGSDAVGVAVARNLGVATATEPIVLFLDDDTVPEPECLVAHAVAHAHTVEHVALGYCPPVVEDSWMGTLLRSWWEDHYRRKREPNHRFTFFDFVTGNASLSRDLLLDLGGFDEAFASRHEDWELGVRLLERGVTMEFHPDAVAPHYLDTSLEKGVLHQRLEGAGDVLLARKHPLLTRQLPLAGFGSRLPRPSKGALRRRVALAKRFETLRLRRRWRRQVTAALRDAYVLGVRDELGSGHALSALVAAAPPPVRVPIRLDGRNVPNLAALGQLEFELQEHGKTIARVSPIAPGRQWDWAEAIDRIAHASAAELGAVLFRRELDAEIKAADAHEGRLSRVP
jgi:GT2 family glycosyltransferase